MSVYLRAKFQVSRISQMSFRWGGGGGNFNPPPQNELLKDPPRLGLKYLYIYIKTSICCTYIILFCVFIILNLTALDWLPDEWTILLVHL